jgi:hypothetical protein
MRAHKHWCWSQEEHWIELLLLLLLLLCSCPLCRCCRSPSTNSSGLTKQTSQVPTLHAGKQTQPVRRCKPAASAVAGLLCCRRATQTLAALRLLWMEARAVT